MSTADLLALLLVVAAILLAGAISSLAVVLHRRRPQPLQTPSGMYPALPAQAEAQPTDEPTNEPNKVRIHSSEVPTRKYDAAFEALEPSPRCVTCNRPWKRIAPCA